MDVHNDGEAVEELFSPKFQSFDDTNKFLDVTFSKNDYVTAVA